MAAPCGCGGSSVVVNGIDPIYVNRTGVRPVTYQVGIGEPGTDPCDYINDCVSGNLGAGLGYDEGTGKFHVRLSQDAGNTLHFGTDSGLKNLSGTGPSPEFCGRTIDSLPETGLVGARSMAGLFHPYGSPIGLEFCLAQNLDIIHFQVATAADGVGVVADYWNNRTSVTRTNTYASEFIRETDSSSYASSWNFAGDPDDPQPYTSSTRVNKDQRRGGWYGWLVEGYHPMLLPDALRRINARSVAFLHCVVEDPEAGTEQEHIAGAIRGVLEGCAQEWAMIGVRELSSAATVIANGMTPVMCPTGMTHPPTWGTTALPYPVADLNSAGVEWILLSNYYADSVYSTYRAAGIQVLMYTNSRQYERERVENLGIRGALAMDPVYYRGPVSSGDYRRISEGWNLRRVMPGQLSHQTDKLWVTSVAGLIRGMAEASEGGLILPENFGAGVAHPNVGFYKNPLPNPETFVLEWQAKWMTLAPAFSSLAKMGVLFGAETDRCPYEWPQGDPERNPEGFPPGQRTLYQIYQRQNGMIGIAKWNSQTSPITYLAELSSPAMVAGQWNSYKLEVTPTQITFTRTAPNSQEYTVTALDSQYRGPYVFFEKEESVASGAANPFRGKFRNVSYTPG